MIHVIASNSDARRLSRSSSWCSQQNNPKYLGRQVWGRHHHGRPTPPAQWVCSPTWAHPPIVDENTFTAAQHQYPTTDHPTAGNDRSGPAA
jgi:hypothetical protein